MIKLTGVILDVKTEIRERETADEVTKIVFKNSYESSLACKELCESCPMFSRLDESDQNLLFEKARYELLIVSIRLINNSVLFSLLKIPFGLAPERTFIYLVFKIFTRCCLDLFILPEQNDHQKECRSFKQHDEATHQLARQV